MTCSGGSTTLLRPLAGKNFDFMQLFPHRTADLRRHKLINWRAVVVEFVERHFQETVAQAEAAGHHEKLYVSQDRPRRTIQLFFGRHEVGIAPDGSHAIEEGATLVLSQFATGAVAVFLYPYESELVRRKEKLIVWGVFDDPLEVTERVLKRAIADFTCYARVSSVLDGGTPADRRRIDLLLSRDKFQSEAKVEAAKRAEEEAREKKETHPGWGTRLANNLLLVLFAIFGTVVTIVSGWHPFVDQLHEWFGKAAPPPVKAPAPSMPVITGWYTFCPQDDSGASPKMLDLLYDIGQQAGKIAFFDVQIEVDCIMGAAPDPSTPVARELGEHSLTYRFSTELARGTTLDGERDSANLYRFLPDNGTSVRVFEDRERRNALTDLGINLEGSEDRLYGPYLIKARGEDAILDLELSAPTLDTEMQVSASAIDQQRHIVHENEPPPKNLPQPIPITADDLRRLREHAALTVTPTGAIPSPSSSSPPGGKSLRKLPLPPLPTPLSASRQKDAAAKQ